MNVLKVGGEYTKSEVKEILRGIYHELGIQGKPSASDITGYLTCKEKTIKVQKDSDSNVQNYLTCTEESLPVS